MRPVHSDKLSKRLGELGAVIHIPSFGETYDPVGKLAAGLVLGFEHRDQIGEDTRFFKSWKEKLFLLTFMIVFDEIADHACRARNPFGFQIPSLLDLKDAV